MMHGTTVIAFVEDPDGYKVEFIQKGTYGVWIIRFGAKQFALANMLLRTRPSRS
jgi:hypothetical protein